MIEVKAYDKDAKAAKAISVSEDVFGGEVSQRLLREAILMYEANARQGTASVLRRGEVSGSTAKLFRQKHTGRARVGDARSPIRRGGGSVFGPKPHSYRYSLPKKALRKALDSAILAKITDGEVAVAECPVPEAPRTKPVAEYMSAIGLAKGATCLYVTSGLDGTFHRSARNIDGMSVMPLSQLNAYAVIRPSMVVFSREAFEKLLEERQ